MKNQKIGILALLAGVLLSAAALATPGLKSANAQANQTAQMNATQGAQGLPVDKWIIVLKKDNPALAKIEQIPDVKDAIAKIRAMQDATEAVKTLNALSALQQLMNIKSVQEAR